MNVLCFFIGAVFGAVVEAAVLMIFAIVIGARIELREEDNE